MGEMMSGGMRSRVEGGIASTSTTGEERLALRMIEEGDRNLVWDQEGCYHARLQLSDRGGLSIHPEDSMRRQGVCCCVSAPVDKVRIQSRDRDNRQHDRMAGLQRTSGTGEQQKALISENVMILAILRCESVSTVDVPE